MFNALTGRSRAVRGGAISKEEAAKSTRKTRLVIIAFVLLAWGLGAGVGYVKNRPANLSVTATSTPAPSVTASPSASPSGTPHPTSTP